MIIIVIFIIGQPGISCIHVVTDITNHDQNHQDPFSMHQAATLNEANRQSWWTKPDYTEKRSYNLWKIDAAASTLCEANEWSQPEATTSEPTSSQNRIMTLIVPLRSD